ncbi:hypothetical protein OIE66_31340 [Nonomuraea sp. NBC_01738]|uniref:hypothetical protein n=1 Tax=Nonomuraea sp. NBC_01738 TaxID=2976003 RepID=UPI002E13CC53|nr:hypothetical protein OIE66_31340 [Nonomuraea sp. NBC_01738]
MATTTHTYVSKVRREGREEGRVEGLAEALLQVLSDNGVVVSDEVRQRIISCEDPDPVRLWLSRALAVKVADELFD